MNKAIFSPVMLFLFPLTCLGDTVPSVPPSMFEVLPNETRVISRPDQMPDAIDYLVMRKNSTLLVNPKVGNWKLTARYGYFEKGSKIVAKDMVTIHLLLMEVPVAMVGIAIQENAQVMWLTERVEKMVQMLN